MIKKGYVIPQRKERTGNSAKLVNDIARQKVDVIVVQLDAGVEDALSAKLVQLGVLHPGDALRHRRLVQVQLQLQRQIVKVGRVEGDHVLGDAVELGHRAAMDGLQHAHRGGGLPVEAIAHVVGVALGAEGQR